MKKIGFLLISIILVWGGYSSLTIYLGSDRYLENIGSFRLLDRQSEILTDIGLPGGYATPYTDTLDTELVHSIIDIEDVRYYSHKGIDIYGKIGAIRDNFQAGGIVRGGSTIVEQYVKNIYYPNSDRTVMQKAREAGVAMILSLRYDKDTLLRKYLDSIYMGNGIYGIGGALEIYFGGKDASELTESEIIEIVTRIRNPNIGKSGLDYADRVSQKLTGKSWSGSLMRNERKKNINLFPHLTERIESEIRLSCQGRENSLDRFIMKKPQNICTSNSLTLATSISKDFSIFSMHTLEGIVGGIEKENVHNGAIYVLDPVSDTVLVYIGNRTANAKENAIDMITERRSVGSVLKPFLYNIALDTGADGESLIMDDTKVYASEDEKSFIPENYVPKSYGPMRLKEALGNSLNSATVRLAETLGIGRIYDTYRRYGLALDHDAGYYGYGIALGAVELTLENIVEGYRGLLSLDDASHFLLYDILSDEQNRSRTFGISSILNTSIPMAVKTGTSTDFHDNWTIGYHRDAIIGVWVGNADRSPMQDVSGVSGAGPIFHHIAEYMIERGLIMRMDTRIPDGISEVSICLDNACHRKEQVYRRDDMTNLSRVLDKKYILSEFIIPVTEDEMKKWNISKE